MTDKLIKRAYVYTEQELLDNLFQAIQQLGKDVSQDRFNAWSGRICGSRTLSHRFGRWNSAKQKAIDYFEKGVGIELSDNRENVSKDELRDNERDALIELLSKPKTIIDISNSLNISPKNAQSLLDELSDSGYEIIKDGEKIFLKTAVEKADDKEFRYAVNSNEFQFAVVSDTHFGSKYQQLTFLKEFYQLCNDRNIRLVLHAGDLVAGNGRVYRGQLYENFYNGFDDQKNYTVEHYPELKNGETWVISGNHDLSFFAGTGADIVQEICNQRSDMKYLGKVGAFVNILENSESQYNIKTYIVHGEGGNAYALSYKIQRHIEGLSSENKPQLFFMGHYHSGLYAFIRNVNAFLVPCFESQTPYLLRKGLFPAVGGWIIKLGLEGRTVRYIVVEYQQYFVMVKNDY